MSMKQVVQVPNYWNGSLLSNDSVGTMPAPVAGAASAATVKANDPANAFKTGAATPPPVLALGK
jgi:hypothetical protein